MGEAEVEETPAEEVRVLDGMLRRLMEENGGVESFVGVLGFSQGARLLPGLLLWQAVETRDRLEGSEWGLKFGVMVGGPYPPIAVHQGVKKEDYALLRDVPTVHAWGREDHVRSGCEVLYDACGGDNGDVCFKMDFEGGHHMPLKDGEARDLCDLIMAAWLAGGGTRAVGANGETY